MSTSPPSEQTPPTRSWKRPLLLIAVVVGVGGIVAASGVTDGLTVEALQAWVEQAGPAAIPAYWALFIAGVCMTIPGNVFVLLGVVLFGPLTGVPLALVGSSVAGTIATRGYQVIGGTGLPTPRLRLVARGLALLDERPVLGVTLIRLALQISAPANVMLALAGVRPRDNLLGTALGNLPVVLLCALAVDAFRAWFLG